MKKSPPETSEKLTRKQLIDRALTNAGWRIVPERDFDPSMPLRAYDRCAIEEYPTNSGPADYALCGDGKILAVVEAKKLTLGPQNVLSQAERYAVALTGKPFSFHGYGEYQILLAGSCETGLKTERGGMHQVRAIRRAIEGKCHS